MAAFKNFLFELNEQLSEFQSDDIIVFAHRIGNADTVKILSFDQSSHPELYSPATILKMTLAQVFSCEFCEVSKNTLSYRAPPVAASVLW